MVGCTQRAGADPLRCRADPDLAEAIHYCHQRGVLHRDLKPSNVLLSSTLEPRITDFGLSKLAEANLTETRTSVLLGTPLYMAPEQADARPDAIGPATDVYALGAILYELLTGRTPFAGRNLAEVLDRIRVQEAVPPAKWRVEVPQRLDTICLCCLHKEPRQRYGSAGALAADLRRYLAGQSIQARRTGSVDRWRAWCRRPERTVEPALIAFMNGAISLTAMVIGVLSVWSGRWPGGPPAAALGEYMASATLFSGAQFALGYFTAARRPWAIGLGLLGIPLLTIYTTGMVFGLVGTGGYFSDHDPAMQVTLHMVAMTLLTIEFLAYLLALYAWNATRGRHVPALPAPVDPTPPPAAEPAPTGWQERLGVWSRQPERIGEAALLAVLNGTVGVLCTLGPVIGISSGGLVVPDPDQAMREMLQILMYYPTIHFVLAACTLLRHGWAIKAGAMVTPVIVVWATGIIFGWIDTGDYYSGRDPAMRLSLELAAGSMLMLQAVLYLLAWRAWQHQQGKRSPPLPLPRSLG